MDTIAQDYDEVEPFDSWATSASGYLHMEPTVQVLRSEAALGGGCKSVDAPASYVSDANTCKQAGTAIPAEHAELGQEAQDRESC